MGRRLSRLECEHGAAPSIDPDAVRLKSPRLTLDARRLRPLLIEPGTPDRSRDRAERVLEASALARNPVVHGAAVAFLDAEQAVAPIGNPDAVALESPRSAVHACGARALLDQPGAGKPPVAWTELPIVTAAGARDLTSAAPARSLEIELGRAPLRHPDSAAVVVPGAALDARRIRLLANQAHARDAFAGRAVVALEVPAFAGHARAEGRGRRCEKRQERDDGQHVELHVVTSSLCVSSCARDRTRTGMASRPKHFKCLVSTCFTTRAVLIRRWRGSLQYTEWASLPVLD